MIAEMSTGLISASLRVI